MGVEKTLELKGAKLNAAVAISLGAIIVRWDKDGIAWVSGLGNAPGSTITCPNYVGCNGHYATELIESDRISAIWDDATGLWRAGAMVSIPGDLMYRLDGNFSTGTTKLEACMRHFAVRRVGETVAL